VLALWVGSCRASDREKKAAAEAALAKEAQHTADSLATVIRVALEKARADSVAAAAARAAADSAAAVASIAVAENATLRKRLDLVGRNGVRIDGDTTVIPLPAPVVEQLASDASTINDLQIAVMRLKVAIENDSANYQAEHAARLLAEARAAALDRVNAAVRAQLSATKPPRCQRTCGAVIGVVTTAATFFALKS